METSRKPKLNGSAIWHRSCLKEIIDPIYGKVSGTIPDWLNGVLIRNGPGLFEFGDTTVNHLFDGMALLHRFEIQNGTVSYQCRFLQSDVYKKNTKANRIVVTDFGTKAVPDPCQTIFSRISSMFYPTKTISDNASISVYPFGDEIYAFCESGIMYKIEQSSLETKTRKNFRDRFGIVTHTSHPHVMQNGTVYNLALSHSKEGLRYCVVCFPGSENIDNEYGFMFDKARVVASVPSKWKFYPSYMHSFGVTDNYFVIIEQPMTLEVPKMLFLKQFIEKPAEHFLKFYNNEMTTFLVVSRKTGKLVKTFYAAGFFYFHTINQYEDQNHIVIDVCTYKDASVIKNFYFDALENAHEDLNFTEALKSVPQRFVLPLLAPKEKLGYQENLIGISNCLAKAYVNSDGNVHVEPETICDQFCETPTFNYNQFLGRRYNYFYGMAIHTDPTDYSGLVKVDIEKKTSKMWWEDGSYPCEPIFVSNPNLKEEDDGVLLSALIYGEDKRRVAFLVLDAKTFEEVGRVEFVTSSPVPRSTHGWYLPKK